MAASTSAATACVSKGTYWTDEERVLLVLWAEPESQEALDGIHRNKNFYEKLAERLSREGFNRRTNQSCRDKVNRVRAQYRALVDKRKLSGQGREDDEPFWFKIVDDILNKNPSTTPVACLDSGAGDGEAAADYVQTETESDDEEVFMTKEDTVEEDGVHQNDSQIFEDSTADGSFDDDTSSTQSNVTTGRIDLDTADTDVMPQEDKKGKGKKKAPKRKAEKVTRESKLVEAMNTSNKEMKKDFQEMEQKQREADEELMEREWQRRMGVEDQRRREDREYARQQQREDRDFKLALMTMMERQTNLLARMIGDLPPQSYSAPPHVGMYNMQAQRPPQHPHHSQQAHHFQQSHHFQQPHHSQQPQQTQQSQQPQQTHQTQQLQQPHQTQREDREYMQL